MSDFKWFISFLTNITLLVLFIRYLTYGYATYGSGTFFSALYRMTDGLCAPLRPLIPFKVRVRSDYTPILAMVLIVLGRGALYSLADLLWAGYPMPGTLAHEIRISVTQFLGGALRVGVIFLLVGAAFLRAGGYYSGLFFRVISDTSSSVFRWVRAFVRVENEWFLFGVASVFGCLLYAILFGIVWLYPFVPYLFAGIVIRVAIQTISFFMIALFIAILLSWFPVDPTFPLVQALRALTAPSLSWARRIFPWARIDMFDLSPLLIFLILVVVESVLASVGSRMPHVRILKAYERMRPPEAAREVEPVEYPLDPAVR
jgi:uncharacterized protein YggT (Ycf19 family)